MRSDTDSKMSKLNPLELFAEKLTPEADRAMTRVVERSTRRQLNAIKQYEDINTAAPKSAKRQLVSFAKIFTGDSHIGLAGYRPLVKAPSLSGATPRLGVSKIVASQQEKLRFGNNNIIVQILEGKDGQQTILCISNYKDTAGNKPARPREKKAALK